jgi:hypothetical protein
MNDFKINWNLLKEGQPTITDFKNSPECKKLCEEVIQNICLKDKTFWKEYDNRTIEMIKEITGKS